VPADQRILCEDPASYRNKNFVEFTEGEISAYLRQEIDGGIQASQDSCNPGAYSQHCSDSIGRNEDRKVSTVARTSDRN
jgi:hypothetical protein